MMSECDKGDSITLDSGNLRLAIDGADDKDQCNPCVVDVNGDTHACNSQNAFHSHKGR